MKPVCQNKKHWFGLNVLFCALILFAGCAGSPDTQSDRRPVEVTKVDPTPRPADRPDERPVSQDADPAPTQTPTPVPDMDTGLGWILTNSQDASLDTIINRAVSNNISQIHLTGNFLHTIDELIFDSQKQSMVEQLARRLDQQGIDLFLWSYELNLQTPTFSFMPSDPLVAARKAAYGNVLRQIPEIDGVVLKLQGAPTPPWEANLPTAMPELSNPERVRFVVDMIRSVVVGEHGKTLMVDVNVNDPARERMMIEAFAGYASREVTILTQPDIAREFEADYPKYGLLDLSGEQFGGPAFVYSAQDALVEFSDAMASDLLDGGLGYVQSDFGSVFDTANEMNVFAFGQVNKQGAVMTSPVSTWLQEALGILRLSPEGVLLQELYRNSTEWAARMYFVNRVIPIGINGSVPQSIEAVRSNWTDLDVNDPRLQRMERDFRNRNKQVMVDLAQESFEAMVLLRRYQSEMENLRWDLKPSVFETFHEPLEHQYLVAQAFFYIKQCMWGFLYWQETRDEAEALHLEAHLQKLSGVANQMEQNYGSEIMPGNPERIREFVNSIRSRFPRVILGWKERSWNKLHDFTFRQSGPNSMEVGWMSNEPSLSKLFVTRELPIYSNVETVSQSYSIEHRFVLQDLQVGETYFIKFQCENEQGEIVNSGDFKVKLDAQMM